MFEIRGISAEAIAAFSTRSAQIEAALGERGTTRDDASSAEKQIAALDTRQAKVATDQASLVKEWRETADGAGFGAEARMALVNAAETKAAFPDHQPAMAMHGDMTADRAIAHASENLGERQSVFSANELQEEAGRYGLGKVSYTQIAQAVDNAAKQGDLLPRSYVDRRGAEFAGFTTRDNVETETKLLRIEAAGRGILPPIASRMDAAKAVASAAADAKQAGFDWNTDQRTATAQLLTSHNRITALQGYAGTAKTTTVLATFAREAETRGMRVTALAPTASAAMVLGEALGTRGDTVTRHLVSPERGGGGKFAVWIVDEASLFSARDSAKLFEQAEKQNARVILVGDVKQLGSVEAGAAFEQLQGAGMETAKLGEIVRQTSSATKEAVLASIAGDARKALAALVPGNHEWYAHRERFTINDEAKRGQELADSLGIHLLQDRQIVIDGVQFLGSTLWTDYAIYGNPAAAMRHSQRWMNDHRVIFPLDTGVPLTPEEALLWHKQSAVWLSETLRVPFPEKTVVVTHHLPHPQSIHPRFARDPLNPAFCSDLSGLVENSGAALWVHGHIGGWQRAEPKRKEPHYVTRNHNSNHRTQAARLSRMACHQQGRKQLLDKGWSCMAASRRQRAFPATRRHADERAHRPPPAFGEHRRQSGRRISACPQSGLVFEHHGAFANQRLNRREVGILR
jgi:AAA domain/TrwC relaxase/Calcineurin-like phosphoesterase